MSKSYLLSAKPTGLTQQQYVQSTHAKPQVDRFQKDVEMAGTIELDNSQISKLQNKGFAPEELNKGVMTTAFNLYAKGHSSIDIIRSIDSNPALEIDAKKHLFHAATVISALEDANPKEAMLLREAAEFPILEISESPSIPQTPKYNDFHFKIEGDNYTSSVVQLGSDKVTGMLRDKAYQALKPGVKTVAKGLWNKAIGSAAGEVVKKAAVTVGGKIGTALAAQAAATAIAPGVANAILAAWQLFGGTIKKIGRKISGAFAAITGIEKPREQIGALFFGGAFAFGVVGLTPVALGAAAIGAVLIVTPTIAVTAFTIALSIPFLLYRLMVAMVVSLITNTFIAILILIFTVIISYTIIQMGAYVVPPGGFGTETEFGVRGQFRPGELNPGYIPDPNFPRTGRLPSRTLYVNMNKTASATAFENNSNSHNVTYTVTICAPRAGLQLREMYCSNTAIDINSEITLPGHDINVSGVNIPPGECITRSYDSTIDANNFPDTAITDRCCVVARTEDTNRGACGSATINIGTPPVNCPSNSFWPVEPAGQCMRIMQTASGHATHSAIEALDFGDVCDQPVRATHRGTITWGDNSSNYGTWVDVATECDGVPMSTRYAHLGVVTVENGQQVNAGDIIGYVDTTGTGNCHLHYEFRQPGSGYRCASGQTTNANGLPCLVPPYLPEAVPWACSGGQCLTVCN
ncbi:MAG: Metalloendopeptidase [Microgenomates group bacterium GW2011_GWC1_37_12b]|nr:MAG: Metalloendopeptidase [Microgenomates group bacterium GW2011_GWC1_37_12b]